MIGGAIAESSMKIIFTSINSVRNGYEANEVENEVHRMHTNIPMFGLISDNVILWFITPNTFYKPINITVYNLSFCHYLYRTTSDLCVPLSND